MEPTFPQPSEPAPKDPRTVEVVLTGRPADLFKVVFFLGQVTGGHDPAEALRAVGLAAITATRESGRGYRATLTLELHEAAA